MWLPDKALARIRELETQLRDSVPKAVHDAALGRIAEQERRIDWQSDMILLAAQSRALPPRAEPKKPEPIPRISETDIGKAKVIIAQGKALGKQEQEIVEAVQSTVRGLSQADIAAAIHAPSNGHG